MENEYNFQPFMCLLQSSHLSILITTNLLVRCSQKAKSGKIFFFNLDFLKSKEEKKILNW